MVLDELLIRVVELKKLSAADRHSKEQELIGEGSKRKRTKRDDNQRRAAERHAQANRALQEQKDDSKVTRERVTHLGKNMSDLIQRQADLQEQVAKLNSMMSGLSKTINEGLASDASAQATGENSANPPASPDTDFDPNRP